MARGPPPILALALHPPTQLGRDATVDVRHQPPERLSSSRRAMKGYRHPPELAEPCRWATFRRSSRSKTGTVAVVYVGMDCGLQRIRGCSDWLVLTSRKML
ncbi:uncharacterized protein LOC100840946 isoform X2 [Brachypodium distachyon]|uniref:Uncharacterized protein n=1 Tax=Brachypodium distachyon TaxID=15368 RepID=A0A0Q3FDU1_BRADI|nr:uncharacterized protein LOC100840946 isoform X2 [Brachypodium distachyon]KQJ96364.1 hypothetical protein BRADI_3g22682v3 [Brachypodium distachyon]|eukprot:XP_024317751.1 uncharacterized protein LOC100840946 isoform X2 [Brachypodium distachyon]